MQTVCQDQTGDFNPRARVGRDDVGARPRRAASHFNPRARVGRDKVKPMVIDREQDFNPRARVGRDFRPDRRPEAIEISIHAPAWGATGAGFSPSSTRTNFNPRARVGRDDGSCLQDRQHLISIHAPAWGATSNITEKEVYYEFQSTRPRGARLDGVRKVEIDKLFQSTRPRGARHVPFARCPCRARISIHAPAWGATLQSAGRESFIEFQSTRPRGARPDLGLSLFIPRDFNPRARVGRDRRRTANSIRSSSNISIHAPAWGATRDEFLYALKGSISIHAPAWGATAGSGARAATGANFNPRARVGRDCADGRANPSHHISIHAPAWGATTDSRPPALRRRFQSTRPRGARQGFGVRISERTRFQSTRPRGARRTVYTLSRSARGISIHAPAWGATQGQADGD